MIHTNFLLSSLVLFSANSESSIWLKTFFGAEMIQISHNIQPTKEKTRKSYFKTFFVRSLDSLALFFWPIGNIMKDVTFQVSQLQYAHFTKSSNPILAASVFNAEWKRHMRM